MKTIGVICEYNPFHCGHQKQLNMIRAQNGEDCGIVCLMSGNFVQRGAPAIFDKSIRAEAALRCGADLVLELPAVYALSSAEGFATGGVEILSKFCDLLCFGAETADRGQLMDTAKALLSPDFPPLLREALKSGRSFPAARQEALEEMGIPSEILVQPNDILAVEYCKAIISTGSRMLPVPICRQGDYHNTQPEHQNPSATSLRRRMLAQQPWRPYIPAAAAEQFDNAVLHSMLAGERAILSRLRCMTEADFEALPYGTEGLWRKLMISCRQQATLEDILEATKSKRYTRTRLNRMVMCAFLGITKDMMQQPVPYTRVLALSDTGRTILKKARMTGKFLHAGEKSEETFWDWEQRWDDLYGLCAFTVPEQPGREAKRRIVYAERKNISAPR